VGLLRLVLTGTAVGLLLTPLGVLYGDIGRGIPLIPNARAWFTGQPPQLLVWMVVRLAMPILIERMSA